MYEKSNVLSTTISCRKEQFRTMLSKLVDFDRFFTRRMVPVAVAIIITAIVSLLVDPQPNEGSANQETGQDQ
jgi:hypothetical protein